MIDKGSNSVDEPMISNSDLPHQSEYSESPGEVDMLIGFIVINGACIVFFIIFGMCVICSCSSKIERRRRTQQQTVEGGEEKTTSFIVPTVDATLASTTDHPSIPVIRNNTLAPLSFDDLDQL